MRIPDVRDRMIVLKFQLSHATKLLASVSAELEKLSNELIRRPSVRKARRTSNEFTPELAVEIRAYAVQHPGVSQNDIAKSFGVNAGRVSEALRGKRE